jgi:hypothetical protein
MEYWEMVTINLSATGAKEAVARLREFLAADGINLKQTHAYEALAQTLGYANWNTLQASLSAAPPADDERRQTATALANKLMTLPEAVLNQVLGAMERSNAKEGSRKAGLTPSLEQCLHRAIALATERRHEFATLEHLLLTLTEDQDAASVFLGCEIDLDRLRNELTGYIASSKLDNLVTAAPGSAKPTTGFQRVVQRAVLHVQNSGRSQVTGANVLVALFSEPDSHAVNLLRQQGMTRTDAVSYVTHGITRPREGDQSG